MTTQNEQNKRKYAYWMRPSMVDEMEKMMGAANASSKSEFVCMAVDFFIGYLRMDKNIDFLAPLLAGAIKNEIASVEQNLCEILFKLAVEQAMANHIAASGSEINNGQINELRKMCASDVAHSNGIITFDKAYRFQKGW